ncbi:hypothetical protein BOSOLAPHORUS_258 [Erwinia phage vB_EamM_Bosolaphorus]|uniref:Uncharacterized protein n=1 Tax=Erwinia phage vB_EamM_Bosolaphorus TaxID=2060126 RepID=A0A2H5BID5_9CAUD|nr:hypothetical protein BOSOLAPHORUS_258 [Erwinia phage vB_EamM_Bosolaphorus]
MSHKNRAPQIKLTGIRDGENDVYIPVAGLGIANAAGITYDPTAISSALDKLRTDRRYFDNLQSHPYYQQNLFTKYIGLIPDDADYRGTPVQRHPFMREMALRFGIALESVRLNSHRQTGKSNFMYYRMVQFHNHYLQEMTDIKASKPIPIDLTRYLKLITGKDFWEKPGVGAWGSEFTELYFHRHQAGSGGKSMFYNMLPRIKLHLAGIHATLGGRPWIYHNVVSRGPAGFWPATIEYGMASNGPAMTAQLNRERMIRPKKGRA